MSRRDRDNARLKEQILKALKEEFPERSMEDILSVIDKNKPLDFMVHGRWQTYSHYEITFDRTTIWFMDNQTGGQIPVKLSQIERWRKDDASNELKAAIMYLKGFKEKSTS